MEDASLLGLIAELERHIQDDQKTIYCTYTATVVMVGPAQSDEFNHGYGKLRCQGCAENIEKKTKFGHLAATHAPCRMASWKLMSSSNRAYE